MSYYDSNNVFFFEIPQSILKRISPEVCNHGSPREKLAAVETMGSKCACLIKWSLPWLNTFYFSLDTV